MSRAEVEQALKTWNFGKTLPVGSDGLLVYDPPNHPAGRRFLFTFCNGSLVAMFWRKGADYMGVKYVLYPSSEQLSMTWQISNNCWGAPR